MKRCPGIHRVDEIVRGTGAAHRHRYAIDFEDASRRCRRIHNSRFNPGLGILAQLDHDGLSTRRCRQATGDGVV